MAAADSPVRPFNPDCARYEELVVPLAAEAKYGGNFGTNPVSCAWQSHGVFICRRRQRVSESKI